MNIKKLKDWLFDNSISGTTGNKVGLLKIGIISLLGSIGNLYLLGTLIRLLKRLTKGVGHTLLTMGIGFLVLTLIFLIGIAIVNLKNFFDVTEDEETKERK